MARYVMFTRLAPASLQDPGDFRAVARSVAQRLREGFPSVRWLDSYAILGPYDIVDLFEAPSEEVAVQVALLVRSVAGVTTETYPAIAWDDFLRDVDALGTDTEA